MRTVQRILIIAFMIAVCSCSDRKGTGITVHPGKTRFRMAGGLGASWHAISQEKIDESPDYKWALRYKNSRGSAWGGNPPAGDTAAWGQICRYASWLGFRWIRVEISARMYEPEKGRYDWENEEMEALYRILDWAEINNADVFLQQMWSNVKWNSYPGVQPLLSAPRSLADFAEGLGNLLIHLTTVRNYDCIKWICITNEPPGGSWGSWWSTGEKNAELTPALMEVRKVLDKNKISIPLSGPDWTDLPVFDPGKIDFDSYIGAYDIHSYQGVDEAKEQILRQWADWASGRNKPLFLSELGDMRIGWKDGNPGPKSFNAALSNAETILRGLNAGVGAFNRWSFTNRSNLDGQWQLIRTWDTLNHQYYTKIETEPQAFYGYAILTRFCSKYSAVVPTDTILSPDLLSQTIRNDKGELTTYILNKGNEGHNIDLTYKGASPGKLYQYTVTEEETSKPRFRMDPVKMIFAKDGVKNHLEIPARSINALTSIHSLHDDPAAN